MKNAVPFGTSLPFANRILIKATVRTMSEHVDLDISGIIRREITISEAGDMLIDMVRRTANGRLTAAEALGHREFVLTKLYRSA